MGGSIMASIINASTSGAGGVITTADASGQLELQTAGTTAVTVDTNQRVAFIAGTAAAPAITTTGDTNTGIFFPAADTIGFTEGGLEAVRITSGGSILVGTTTDVLNNAGTLGVQINNLGAIYTGKDSTVGRTHFGFWNPNGQVGSISTSASTTSYNTSSDYRLKENIAPMTGALEVIAQLNPVTYTWKADGSDGQGFIAHELQEVVPECVSGEKDGVDAEGNPEYQGVDTSFLVATLTAAIQELKARIEVLEGASA
jgi:hypothetical protein